MAAPVSARPPPPPSSHAHDVALPPAATPPEVSSSPPAVAPLISLERPFDIEEFSQMLGEPVIRISVPREYLAEVLRRVSEFMEFGIYVYSIRVRPSPGSMLKSFEMELQRVDYSNEHQAWVSFEEKGRADNPFGPGGRP